MQREQEDTIKNEDYPTSIVVTQYAPDGKSTVEYIYTPSSPKHDPAPPATLPLPVPVKATSFTDIVQIKKRSLVIAIKLFVSSTVLLALSYLVSPFAITIPDFIIILSGAFLFALIPFSVLIATMRDIIGESRNQRNKPHYRNHY